jgi:hypothetical protein
MAPGFQGLETIILENEVRQHVDDVADDLPQKNQYDLEGWVTN